MKLKAIALLGLACILAGCGGQPENDKPEVPKLTANIFYADTIDIAGEKTVISFDLDYPIAMFPGNGNKEVSDEINRMVFCDTVDASFGELEGRLRKRIEEKGSAFECHLKGRFTDGKDSMLCYTLTDSIRIIRTGIFNMFTGKKATLEEVCGGDYREILGEQLNAHKYDKGENAGYFIDKLPLPETYSIAKFGITFHFNAGEVAPVEKGIVSVTVPWGDFR